jgi:hypothetical protein
VKERTHARVVRHQRQHLVSSRRTRDQANHTRPIEVCHSIRADVSAAAVVDGLAVQQHGHRDAARGSRLHDQVHLPSSEWEQNLVCAPSELDVLTFGSPVALERDTTGLASVSSNIRRIRDPRVTRQRPARVCCPLFERHECNVDLATRKMTKLSNIVSIERRQLLHSSHPRRCGSSGVVLDP